VPGGALWRCQSVLAMKLFRAIREFAANVWLAAAPLVVLVLLPIALFICLFVAEKIVALTWGREAADTFLANTMTLLGASLVLGLIGLLLYALFAVARWLLRSKNP
jgi:hypothetical protein